MGSAIIEVGIGLVLVYLVLSIVMTQINNVVVNALNLRAENLREWFQDVIADENLRTDLLSHPMINIVKTQAQVATEPSGNPILNFFKRIGRWLLGFLVPGARDRRYTSKISYVAPSVFSDVLFGILIKDQGLYANLTEEQKVQLLVQTIRERVEDTPLEETLATVIATATSLQEAQSKVEAWFNSSMSNLSDTFKRRVNVISFIMSFLVAFILNVDSLYVARTLWNDSTLRETLVAAAQREIRTLDIQVEAANTGQVNTEAAKVQANIQGLLELRLPIGWHIISVPAADPADANALLVRSQVLDDKRNLSNLSPAASGEVGTWLGFMAYKIVGWIITTFAIMQGSDFWFNLLRQLSSARTTTATITSPSGTTTATINRGTESSSGGVG